MMLAQEIESRLQDELEKLTKNPLDFCTVTPINNDIGHWEVMMQGPPETPYDGGVFKLEVQFPPAYPVKPPRIEFRTQIYHMNITDGGTICLNITGKDWTSNVTTCKILTSIYCLMVQPNPNDPLDRKKSSLWMNNLELYKSNAAELTRKHATNGGSQVEPMNVTTSVNRLLRRPRHRQRIIGLPPPPPPGHTPHNFELRAQVEPLDTSEMSFTELEPIAMEQVPIPETDRLACPLPAPPQVTHVVPLIAAPPSSTPPKKESPVSSVPERTQDPVRTISRIWNSYFKK